VSTLCIAIPTYNRAEKLKKALSQLLKEILITGNMDRISILISDNGSTDNTHNVIKEYRDIFTGYKISFKRVAFKENQGFDKNLLKCYENCSSDYIWCVSDDDIISSGAIDVILEDINSYNPNVIYYNFDQPPYTRINKYISETHLYKKIDSESLQSITKIINWAKLSALVLKKIEINQSFVEKEFKFMHASLAVYIGLHIGQVLHSKVFIAKVDDDYLDQIDFVPFVGNYMVENIEMLMKFTGNSDLFNVLTEKYPLTKVDPVESSLKHLANVYKAGLLISEDLEKQLNNIICDNIHKNGRKVLLSPGYLKFGYAFLYKYFPLSIISSLRRYIRHKYKSKNNMLKIIRKKISNIISSPKKFVVHSYSQFGEDILVKSALESLGVYDPTYLDIGANHPFYLSNTYLFYSAGCRGVLVEPNIVLCENLKKKRKKDICLNFGIGVSDDAEADFYIMDADVLSTFSKSEAESVEAQGTYCIDKIVSVPLVNVNSIIDEYFTKTPNFVSIDVEGLDLSILQSFDFSNHRPEVFCVETLEYNEHVRAPKIKEIINFMLENDYLIYADTHINTIFVDNKRWNQVR